MQTHTVSTSQFGWLRSMEQHISIHMNLHGFLFYVLVSKTLIHLTALWHSAAMYMMLPRSPRNRNAARKPLVVQLCAARYRKQYPLWITLPSDILLWGCVFFFCAFLWRHGSAVLRSYRPVKMTDVKEQWICTKFCFKLSKTAFETDTMLKEAFGDNTVGQTHTYKWFKHFKNGWMSVDDEQRSWRPLTRTTNENVAKVWQWRHCA